MLPSNQSTFLFFFFLNFIFIFLSPLLKLKMPGNWRGFCKGKTLLREVPENVPIPENFTILYKNNIILFYFILFIYCWSYIGTMVVDYYFHCIWVNQIACTFFFWGSKQEIQGETSRYRLRHILYKYTANKWIWIEIFQ